MGYLKGKTNNKIFILFGKEKNKLSDYYMVPVENDQSSIKIPIDDYIIKDIYSIPKEITVEN